MYNLCTNGSCLVSDYTGMYMYMYRLTPLKRYWLYLRWLIMQS